jgi:hypothetical protein
VLQLRPLRGPLVRVKYLIAKGTSDDHMWPLLKKKLKVLNDVGLSRDTFGDTTSRMQVSAARCKLSSVHVSFL